MRSSLGDPHGPSASQPDAGNVSIGLPDKQAVASGTVFGSLERILEQADCLLRAVDDILWRVKGQHGNPDVEDSPAPAPPGPHRFLAATDEIQAVLSRTTAKLAEAISIFDENFGA
jgi:hypothetical protein